MYRPNPVQAQAPARLPPHIEAALRAAGLGMSSSARAAAAARVGGDGPSFSSSSPSGAAAAAAGGATGGAAELSAPSAPRAAAEDAAGDGGEAIETFAAYRPTALPPVLLRIMRERELERERGVMEIGIGMGMGTGPDGEDGAREAAAREAEAGGGAGEGAAVRGMGAEIIELLDTDAEDSNLSGLGEGGAAGPVVALLDTDAEDGGPDTGVAAAASSSPAPAQPSFPGADGDCTGDCTGEGAGGPLPLLPPSRSHTSPAVESALLASAPAPVPPDEAVAALEEPVRLGRLSPLQAEGAALAVGRFQRVLVAGGEPGGDGGGGRGGGGGGPGIPLAPGSSRAGFFLGDGAGVGKGRQIAAIVRDSCVRGHGGGRHLWLSVGRELLHDAARDLADVGCSGVDVHDGADVLDAAGMGAAGSRRRAAKGLGAGGGLGRGVLFVTYSLLVSGRRVEEIVQWLAGAGREGGTLPAPGGGRAADRSLQARLARERRIRAERSYSGVLVFDEAHRAKNLEAETRTARLVLALQERLPNARVLYASATGVSDIKHMAYATRLGLWGAANPLYPTFDAFRGALEKRGVGAMEMLALEMKRKGMFLARTLSWDGADFETVEVRLSSPQVRRYDLAVQWWFNLRGRIQDALDVISIAPPKMLMRTYWSAHQRFFREMCICAKVDEVADQAKRYLQDGHAVVVGLQSTGEAGMEVALQELAETLASNLSSGGTPFGKTGSGGTDLEDVLLPTLVSTCASIMTNFCRNHFPVAPPPPEVPKVPEIPPSGFSTESERVEYLRLSAEAERIQNLPAPAPIPALVAMRAETLEAIRDLDLPANPLDDLIDRLGGVDNVAEMTGRSGRVLRDSRSGKYCYVKRIGGQIKQKSYGLSMPTNSDDATDRLNLVEKKKFMAGQKNVAIISDAASTGISLHAENRSESAHKRRVHFTIELPWAADKAIQQLGRTHRSGQRTAPIYKMVVTELGGERRFAAAVSKRMANLGALTKGDRRAATGTDLSKFDIDSAFGKRALNRVYISLRERPFSTPSRNTNAILDQYIAASTNGKFRVQGRKMDVTEKRNCALSVASEALDEVGLNGDANVKHFLNRIAGLKVTRQNLVFSLFMSTLDDVITDAKATGEFEGSVEDVKATSVKVKGTPKLIATDASCGAPTTLTKIELDRGVSFGSILEPLFEEGDFDKKDDEGEDGSSDNEDARSKYEPAESGFYISRRKIAGRHLIMYAKRKVEAKGAEVDVMDPMGLMVVTRPNTGKNPCEMTSRDLRYKYKLAVSSSTLVRLIRRNGSSDASLDERDAVRSEFSDTTRLIRKNHPEVAKMWDDAYDESNYLEHHKGLAPRISELGLITGAVLHVLPALEKAVLYLKRMYRSLRVMRVELTESRERLVGIRFPLNGDAVERLTAVLKELTAARRGTLESVSFRDERFLAVDAKAACWVTAERKTMKSFFGAAAPKGSGSSSVGNKRKEPTLASSHFQNKKRAMKGPAKSVSITSFFGTKS